MGLALCSMLQAAKGWSIKSISSKLKKNGVVYTGNQKMPQAEILGPNPPFFSLGNLFAGDPGSSTPFRQPLYLGLRSAATDAALGDGDSASDMRVRKILVRSKAT